MKGHVKDFRMQPLKAYNKNEEAFIPGIKNALVIRSQPNSSYIG